MRRTEYNIIVKKHTDNLYGYAIKFLHDREEAKDIVQDVFEKLWIHRRKVEFEKAKSWMFTTAHNTMINLCNRKGRFQLTDQIAEFEKSRVIRSKFEMEQLIDNAVSILPPVQKSIILLRDLEGYSYKEIGFILELSESQVKVYLFRARKKIKKQLKGLLELV